MAATVENGGRSDVAGTPFDLSASQSGKGKSRAPEILAGTLLVAVFALAGAWFYSTSTQSVGYITLGSPVARGEVVEASDLIVSEINNDARIRAVRWSDRASIIGQVALVDMGVGTLVAPEQFSDSDQIPAGFGVVGLNLSPGEFPTLSLQPGDLVRVIVMPAGDDLTAESVAVIADGVEIVAVAGDGNQNRFVSLVLEAELADLVAAADFQDRVRLIQVPEG
jgi:hypothetical protein